MAKMVNLVQEVRKANVEKREKRVKRGTVG
jgi:hypothetical protein